MTENKFLVSWCDYKGNQHGREVEAMTNHGAMNQIRCEDLSYKNITAISIPQNEPKIKDIFP